MIAARYWRARGATIGGHTARRRDVDWYSSPTETTAPHVGATLQVLALDVRMVRCAPGGEPCAAILPAMSESPSPYAAPASSEQAPSQIPTGGAISVPTPGSPPSPVVAALLSLLLPGLGQIYARRTARGLAWLLVPVGVLLMLVGAMRASATAFLLVMLSGLVDTVGVRVLAVIDAVYVARKSAARLPVVGTILWGLALVGAAEAQSFGTRRYVTEAYKMPSGSMIPTLLVGDHVMIDKLRSPRRGDVVVFPFPEHPDQKFVKRIVGMPGETLAFRQGHPVINGVEVPSCRVGSAAYVDVESATTNHEGDVYVERLEGRAYLTFYDRAGGLFPAEQGPYAVGGDEYFMVGDNRWNSHDSRMWYGGRGGGVPTGTVTGTPFVIWLSSKTGGLDWTRIGLDPQVPHLPESMKQLQPALDACLARMK
jgi:signal peptidase I